MAGLIEDKNPEAAPSFEDGMRAAEEAAGIPSDEELYGQAFATPEPDEAGRVPNMRGDDVITDEPAPEEPAAEEAVEETPEEPEVVAEVPTVDELAELKHKVGQMANENAEMRRMLEQAQQAQYQQPQPQLDGNALAWFDEIVEQAPDQAAVWAAQQQQPLLYERAIRSWHDIDPVAAARYERSMEWNQLQQQMAAQIAPQIQGAQELHADAERQAAMRAVQARHDDFDQVMNGLTDEEASRIMASGFPTEVLPMILNGSREGAEKALETLYAFRKASLAPAMVQGAVEAVESAKEEAKAAKREATVASATTTTPAPVEETEGERLMRVWKEQTPSLRDGWENRGGR